MITQDSIEALKSRLDIVDVVGSYIELKKSGANFKALCPFHGEKTPSFVVSPKKQIFHCFSCGLGGDSVKFVMEYDKLSYPEAIEKLASIYNFSLSYSEAKAPSKSSNVLGVANDYYKKMLLSNHSALEYLKQRGLYESSIELFEIGYAPSSSYTLNLLRSNFISYEEALKYGLIGLDNSKTFARFIERITFPIYSPTAKLVGFGGRTITNHQAKYVNSPETPFFNKSKLLYAYHLAKDAIFKTKEIIITEGYLDVIMLHQAGFSNAVATLGTALTSEHLPLLRKSNSKIIVAYDGDKAGRDAALRASKLLSQGGFDGGVVLFRDGKDPADMIKDGLVDELNDIFKKPKPFIEFVFEEILNSYDIKNPKAKESAFKDSLEYLKTLSVFLQEEYKNYLSSLFGGIKVNLAKISKTQQLPTKEHKDTFEMVIVKTVMEQPEFIDTILDTLDPSLLRFHSLELKLALEQKFDANELVAIMLDDNIKPIKDETMLKRELNAFLIKNYENTLKSINSKKELSFEEISFYIRKYRGAIDRLKKARTLSI